MIYTLYQYQHRESGKQYIGITNQLAKRSRRHSVGKSGARAFNFAVKKYGIDAFDFKVLALFDRVDAACYHEQAAILKFGTLAPLGYNCRAGQPYTKYAGSPSPETRKKISDATTGHHVVSEETRIKQSMAHKGMPSAFRGHHHSTEAKAKLSASSTGNTNATGYQHSDKTRFNMSVAHLGHHPTLETLAKMSTAHLRYFNSSEAHTKLSTSLLGNSNAKGYHHSKETRLKMSRAQKARWAIKPEQEDTI
jgi:group I intron endonuclease